MNELPSAEILRRARPIPTYRDHPAASPVDVEGVDHRGMAARVAVRASIEPILLLFLSSDCLGCQDLWAGTAALRGLLPDRLRMAIVTRGPVHEDVAAISALAPADTLTVMSTQAYRDYRVGGAPFLVVATGDEVMTEGVAWGIDETARAVRLALGDTS